MSRCTILRHVHFEGPGSFEPVLRGRGWDIGLADVAAPGDIPADAGTADLLLILGGPDSVYDHAPHLQAEILVARARLAAGLPTLGICLGAQIMAAALGATVRPGPRREIGWHPIELAGGAEHDPVASALVARTPRVFHWHGDTFDLPAGTNPIARSHAFQVQRFRYGDHAVAIQFHPEMTLADLPLWIEGYRDELARTPEAQPAEEMLRLGEALDPLVRDQAGCFLHAYLDRIQG